MTWNLFTDIDHTKSICSLKQPLFKSTDTIQNDSFYVSGYCGFENTVQHLNKTARKLVNRLYVWI